MQHDPSKYMMRKRKRKTYAGLGDRRLAEVSSNIESWSWYLDIGTAIGWPVVHECGTLPTSRITILILLLVFKICTASSCVASSKLWPLTSRIWSPTCISFVSSNLFLLSFIIMYNFCTHGEKRVWIAMKSNKTHYIAGIKRLFDFALEGLVWIIKSEKVSSPTYEHLYI